MPRASWQEEQVLKGDTGSPLAWRESNEAVRDLSRALCAPNRVDDGPGSPGKNAVGPERSQCDISVRDGGPPDRLGTHTIKELASPGGFRRQYVAPSNPFRFPPLLDSLRTTSNFYTSALESLVGWEEDDPLLTPLKEEHAVSSGDTSSPSIVIAIFKIFMCSAITFLPKGFNNGGYIFSPIALLFFCGVCSHCVFQLVEVREKIGYGSFGEIARLTLGPVGVMVDISITLSQVGYCTALALWTANVLARVCSVSVTVGLFVQILPLAPLCCIRKVRLLAIPALIADVLIVGGLVIIIAVCLQRLSANGVAEVVPVASNSPIFLGTAIYSFEGIGNIMPIYESMRHRQHFRQIFSTCMLIITSLFIVFALVVYLAYGSDVPTVAVLILPKTHFGYSVQAAYALAVLLTFPLVMLPASRICGGLIFKSQSSPPLSRKVLRSFFNIFLVAVIMVISWLGQSNLDHLVAFVGSFCCVPLGLIYPPWMHLRAFPEQGLLSKAVKFTEILLGLFCMIFTSYIAIASY